MSNSIRFRLDEDNDIIDNDKINIYQFNSQKDWERLIILLNSLQNYISKLEKNLDIINSTFLEEYEEFNEYIDEYSLIKVDILMDLADKMGIELE